MRDAIIQAVHRRMGTDPRLYFLCADVGINLVERIRDSFPDRFLNVGIAEGNMIGVAAGLCNAGFRPICYTFSQFITQRCFEQLRDDIVLHGYPIVLLGSTTGFDNCQMGPTHHVVDDWGTVRNLPGLEIHCPSSVAYAEWCINDVLDRNVMAYIRIPKGKGNATEEVLHLGDDDGEQGEMLLVSYGTMTQPCLWAQDKCPKLSVLIVQQLRPLAFNPTFLWHKRIVVVEDHFAETGLYASVCQVVAQHRLNVEVHSRAPQGYYRMSGDTPAFFWRLFRGDAESIVQDFGA